MLFKIIGICGSPVKDGNTATFLDSIMSLASAKGHQTETVYLSEMDINDCRHCNFCLTGQKPGKYCANKDDAQVIFEKLEAADIIVLASPVYFMRTSGRMAAFIDRLRVFVHGALSAGKLRNKIGISAGVSWFRHGGMETTHLSHLYAFATLDMIPATTYLSICPLGASAVASKNGAGEFDRGMRIGVNEDKAGLESSAALLSRALELAELLSK